MLVEAARAAYVRILRQNGCRAVGGRAWALKNSSVDTTTAPRFEFHWHLQLLQLDGRWICAAQGALGESFLGRQRSTEETHPVWTSVKAVPARAVTAAPSERGGGFVMSMPRGR
jgi:hypothetical protein